MVYEELIASIKLGLEKYSNEEDKGVSAKKAFNILRAIAYLHTPVNIRNENGDCVLHCDCCVVSYPCKTISIINQQIKGII